MKQSAALLVYRRRRGRLEVFLVHPGGPFWAKKDAGAWSIPKGEFTAGEDILAAARREFLEEVGQAPDGDFVALAPARQPSRKVIHTWAVEGDVDEGAITSNLFEMEWPPKSGRRAQFPEVDRGRWFALDEAKQRIQSGQVPILEELARKVEEKQ
jgi:predicted NUDIX family NTP pyrophosphohydrolase